MLYRAACRSGVCAEPVSEADPAQQGLKGRFLVKNGVWGMGNKYRNILRVCQGYVKKNVGALQATPLPNTLQRKQKFQTLLVFAPPYGNGSAVEKHGVFYYGKT